jgi:hypothetical protein
MFTPAIARAARQAPKVRLPLLSATRSKAALLIRSELEQTDLTSPAVRPWSRYRCRAQAGADQEVPGVPMGSLRSLKTPSPLASIRGFLERRRSLLGVWEDGRNDRQYLSCPRAQAAGGRAPVGVSPASLTLSFDIEGKGW